MLAEAGEGRRDGDGKEKDRKGQIHRSKSAQEDSLRMWGHGGKEMPITIPSSQ